MAKSEAAAAPRAAEGPIDRRIIEQARIAVPIATIVLAVVAGVTLGPPSAMLVLAGGALIGVIATFWASVRTLLGETPLTGADAYALGAPAAEVERKRAVLRAIKDLEFERSVGKISDEDYQVLIAKYRAEAKGLLRIIETAAEPARREVESLVAKRLRKAGLLEGVEEEAVAEAGGEEEAAPRDKPKSKKAKRREERRRREAELARKAEAGERAADRDRERDTDTDTDRDTDRETDRDRETDGDRETDRDREEAEREAEAAIAAVVQKKVASPAARATDAETESEGVEENVGHADTDPPPGRGEDVFADTEKARPVKTPSNPPAPPAPLAPLRKKANGTVTMCADCGTANDEDAVFCKKCGKRRAAAASSREEET